MDATNNIATDLFYKVRSRFQGLKLGNETGEITRGRYGDPGLQAERQEGVQHLLKDIANGDQQKLGTVLGFFKRTLITG